MAKVIIGVDPHKLSATIEVVDRHERLLGSGRFSTDQAGYNAMRTYAKTGPERVWAIEGSNGAGRPLAQRLLEAGEHVVDVPAKLAARVRLFDTGHNRKTDARDAHSIAIVAVRTKTLRVLHPDGELEALRMLCDRREELTQLRVQTVNTLQRLLAELVPGKAKKDLTALQAKAILATVRPRDIAGKTRRRIAADELADLLAGRGEDEEGHRRAQGLGQGPRLTADRTPRCRTRGRGPDTGRRRRHRQGRRPQPVRILDRHRAPGCLIGRAEPAPALPGREPTDEPHDPHRSHQPDPPRHPGPCPLPAQARRRQDQARSAALPEAEDLRRRIRGQCPPPRKVLRMLGEGPLPRSFAASTPARPVGSGWPPTSRSRCPTRPGDRRVPGRAGSPGLPVLQRHPRQHAGHPRCRLTPGSVRDVQLVRLLTSPAMFW